MPIQRPHHTSHDADRIERQPGTLAFMRSQRVNELLRRINPAATVTARVVAAVVEAAVEAVGSSPPTCPKRTPVRTKATPDPLCYIPSEDTQGANIIVTDRCATLLPTARVVRRRSQS